MARRTLFQQANAAQQRARRRAYSANRAARAISSLRKAQKGGADIVEGIRMTLEAIDGKGAKDVDRQATSRTKGVDRYALREEIGKALGGVFRKLGQIGDVLENLVTGGRSTIDDSYNDAVDLIRAMGGEVLEKPGKRGYGRGLEAALQLLEEADLAPEAPTTSEPEDEELLIATETGPSSSPGTAPPRPGESDWSEEINVGSQSSNVWSYQYHFPSSTLRVTYKAPSVNSGEVQNKRGRGGLTAIRGNLGKTVTGKANAPGTAYHYYDVPARVFKQFTIASSKGKFVWDRLRVRGTIYGHQYRYGLAQAALIPGEDGKVGAYVPRRATAKGFRTRTLAEVGRGKRRYLTSTLPEQRINRGQPDRGTPNRGLPNRGR